MKKIHNLKYGLLLLATVCSGVLLSSCTTTPVSRVSLPPEPQVTTIHQHSGIGTVSRTGTYHSVGPGETLWRIARMYDVDADSIKKANRILDPRNIGIGQRLYIPAAKMRRNVLTLYPSDKWRYIIIHHSATDYGNAARFHEAHKKRGWSGIGYHFVIDNGSFGKDDGQIETTPRWIYQTDGAHCSASGMNEKGIGICLVGNFSETYVTSKQMDSLVFLVQQLKDFYDIPKSNIMGHGQVPGARTECPGKQFDWDAFWRRLN